MKIHPFFKKILLGLILMITVRAEASVIYSYTGFLVVSTVPHSPDYALSYGIDTGSDFPRVGPWDISLLNIDQVSSSTVLGQTFVLNAENDANFNAFVAQITNGTPDVLGLSMVSNTGSGYLYQNTPESDYFFPSGGTSVDLIGNTITQIEISFFEDRIVDDVFTPDFEARYVVAFLDTPVNSVPDSSSTLRLLGIALIPAFVWHRRRSQ